MATARIVDSATSPASVVTALIEASPIVGMSVHPRRLGPAPASKVEWNTIFVSSLMHGKAPASASGTPASASAVGIEDSDDASRAPPSGPSGVGVASNDEHAHAPAKASTTLPRATIRLRLIPEVYPRSLSAAA